MWNIFKKKEKTEVTKYLPSWEIDDLKRLSQHDWGDYCKFLERRLNNEPMAYIKNKTRFHGHDFYVDKTTYVPTKETNNLVNLVLSHVDNFYNFEDEKLPVRYILDVGTGCGAIGISIEFQLTRKQKEILEKMYKKTYTNKDGLIDPFKVEDWAGSPSLVGYNVIFSDICKEALSVAKNNFNRIMNKIDLYLGGNNPVDVFPNVCRFYKSSYVDEIPIIDNNPRIIVANLPWGTAGKNELKSNKIEELKYMPKIAVFHPKGDMGAYEELFESIEKKQLKNNSWHPKVFIETGLMPEELVAKSVPKGKDYVYVTFPDYSATIVQF